MKSIQNQYIDLKEGKMSQANFMRNMRMSLPQYITNVTSFGDTVKILTNKGILSEASLNPAQDAANAEYTSPMDRMFNSDEFVKAQQDAEGGDDEEEDDEDMKDYFFDIDTEEEEPSINESKIIGADGKEEYSKFPDKDTVNGQELMTGIFYEMTKNCELSKEEACKIAIKKIKQVPNYYTMAGLAGVEGTKPEYIGGKSANPEAHQMQYLDKNMGNVVDKKRGMQPVKDVEKFKKDSTAGGVTNKTVEKISLMSLVATSVRGVQKMSPTGEKVKIIKLKEEKNYSQSNLKLTPEQTSKIKRVLPDAEFEWDADDRKQVVYSNKSEKEIQNIVDQVTGAGPVSTGIKQSGVAKFLTKEDLKKMVREELDEITGAYGGDAMSAEDGSSYINEEQISPEDLDKAAKVIRILIPKSSDISDEMDEDYKYGAFSFEAWEEVAKAMKAIGHDPSPTKEYNDEFFSKVSDFVKKLKDEKLIYLEW
jgi:hypothetical protein